MKKLKFGAFAEGNIHSIPTKEEIVAHYGFEEKPIETYDERITFFH